MSRGLRGIALCALVALAAGHSNQITPIQKVVQMMNDMVTKCKEEKKAETIAMTEKQVLCDRVRKDKTTSIAEAKAQIVQLTADNEKAHADAEFLAEEVAKLQEEVAVWDAEGKQATANRHEEKADYEAEHHDVLIALEEVSKALKIVRSGLADVGSSASLLQIQNMAALPPQAKAAVASLLAMREENMAPPQAATYQTHGDGLLEILEDQKKKYEDLKAKIEMEEIQAHGAYEMVMQQLHDNTAQAEETIAEKTATKAQRLEDAAKAKSDRSVTQDTLANDEQTLTDSLAECDAASKEFEQNQVTRRAEIDALTKATEIMSSDSVSGNADKHLPALIQIRASALVQLPAGKTSAARQNLVEFLQGRAQRTGSQFLTMAASHAAADSFGKIKKMIKDMIVKLMEQANAEADKNAYCTSEMATNKMTRDNKAAEVEDLSAQIDELTALSATLTTELAELADNIASLKSQQSDATKVRFDEKATNTKTIEDAKEGQVAVDKAIKVLEGFYGQQSAMLQDSASIEDQMKQVEKKPYTGMSGGGVFAMLDVIMSDFARLETETSTTEMNLQSAYEKFSAETTESVEVYEVEQEHKSNKKMKSDERNRNLQKERELTQGELDTALEYFEKLKAECVDTGMSYEARVQAREEEIQSLKEALEILAQQELA